MVTSREGPIVIWTAYLSATLSALNAGVDVLPLFKKRCPLTFSVMPAWVDYKRWTVLLVQRRFFQFPRSCSALWGRWINSSKLTVDKRVNLFLPLVNDTKSALKNSHCYLKFASLQYFEAVSKLDSGKWQMTLNRKSLSDLFTHDTSQHIQIYLQERARCLTIKTGFWTF